MTNMEHYREEIEALNYDIALCNGKVVKCTGIGCHGCDYQDEECSTKLIKWLMAEYKESVTLTAREKHFVEFAEDGWLARDESGELYFYKDKPHKRRRGWWENALCRLKAFGDLFPFIKWEDKEPWSVEELRKLPALEYNPEDVAFKGGATDE